MEFHWMAQTALFRGCTEAEIALMAKELGFTVRRYQKGEVLLREGSTTSEVGLVLSGSVQMEHIDLWGNKTILGVVGPGEVFAEAYACLPGEPVMIDVIANEDGEVLYVSVPKLFASCPVCGRQGQLLENLVRISAAKNVQFSRRSLHTAPKTIRGRLLSYFSHQVMIQDSRTITIPFDRQQLADYLNLDRSALSKELGKMKRDGLIQYRKNVFWITAEL